jgi:tRNA-specific 2-thiouridylase
MNEQKTVVVAMSGGVDSSVAAALMVEQGYRVVGMMLRLWSEPGQVYANRCCTPDAMAQARRVASMLGIPFYAVDGREKFRQQVVQSFLDGYVAGVTPNPCLVCNRHIRWGLLLKHAQALGADYMATGHYAQVRRGEDGRFELWQGIDEHKDQSYVLSGLNQEQLAHTLLPLGEMEKPIVRQQAHRFQLPVAERPDSQDLCFLGNADYRQFLVRHAPEATNPGQIVTRDGAVLGQHEGLAFYTIGQRKGLGIASEQPLYVLEKDLRSNRLVVGEAGDLGRRDMRVAQMNWIAGEAPQPSFRAQVKIRYKALLAWAEVNVAPDGALQVLFDQPVRDITPGQLAVFYQDRRVLGGGLIQAVAA